MVIKLDRKDRKILLELSKDCRQNINSLAKRLQLSRDVVNYRIKKLLKEGIIEKFLCEINFESLGYKQNYIFLTIEKFSPERYNEIIQALVNYPYVMIVMSCTGKYDIIIEVVSRDNKHFNQALNEINLICGNNLLDYEVLTTLEEYKLLHSYFLPELSYKDLISTEKINSIELEKKDYLILKALEEDASKPIHKISSETGIQRDTVLYRTKKLKDEGIIKSFRASINPKPSGYEWYMVMLKFENFTKETEEKIKGFLFSNINVIFAVKIIGKWHYHFEIIAKDQNQFEDIIMNIRQLFKNNLRRPETLIIFKEHKYTNLPIGIINDALNRTKIEN